ncbi:protein MIX23 [Hyalella azteca]|uniref:Protein MIX23 n=1 Tax=Hyalella azteca TaxID=294128 RepID=A0A8B7NTK6_HYAAZ|nr:protein MIX23 [Hyalella azteca]
MAARQVTNCEDVQYLLRNLRVVDDKIIYALNLATPTQSFRDAIDPAVKCKQLFEELAANYKERSQLLERCLEQTTTRLTELRSIDPSTDTSINNRIKSERSKVRELRNEIAIEEILRERGRKVFSERCFPHYRGYEGW